MTDLPIAYVYAALLIDKKVFSKISAEDQQVVREVMEGIYRKFDQNGVIDNGKALQALLDNGLQMVSPDTADITEWRSIVNLSYRRMAEEGTFDISLLDSMQALLEDYRGGAADVAP